jgi:PncC family amidohydrolase
MIKNQIHKLKKIRKAKKFKLSTAESCTGGLLSSSITEYSGASEFFDSSYIVYSNNSKVNLLKVPKNIIKQFGSVSHQTSLYMAKGLRKKTKSDIVVSITGVAGPKGGTKKNPVGTVYFTIGYKKNNRFIYESFHKKFKNDNRKYIQKKSVIFSLDQVLRVIT